MLMMNWNQKDFRLAEARHLSFEAVPNGTDTQQYSNALLYAHLQRNRSKKTKGSGLLLNF